MEEYITGTGQRISVHEKSECKGDHCVIHNPSDHHMKDWPTHWRDDLLLMERICPCGVGHPDPDDLVYRTNRYIEEFGKDLGERKAFPFSVHGCCGCCNKELFQNKIVGKLLSAKKPKRLSRISRKRK